MNYTGIVGELFTPGVGKLDLEELVAQIFREITGFDVRGLEIDEGDTYFNAIVYYYMQVNGGLPITNKLRIQFNDVKFFIKKYGRESYDKEWQKRLYGNLISQEDKKQLESEICNSTRNLGNDNFC